MYIFHPRYCRTVRIRKIRYYEVKKNVNWNHAANSFIKAMVRENACALCREISLHSFLRCPCEAQVESKGTRHYIERIFSTQRKSRIKIPFKEAPRVLSIHQPLVGRGGGEGWVVSVGARNCRFSYTKQLWISVGSLARKFASKIALSSFRGLLLREKSIGDIIRSYFCTTWERETPIDRWMARLER